MSVAGSGRGVLFPRQSWYKDLLLVLLVGAIMVIDQVTKHLVRTNLSPGQSIPSDGIFRITYTINTGSAFGLFPNQTLFLILASLLGIVVLLVLYRNHPFPGVLLRVSLGLQLGGALGNLADRLRDGRVTDFIQLGFWPVFNLADASIMTGIFILLWLFLVPRKAPQPVGMTNQLTQENVLSPHPEGNEGGRASTQLGEELGGDPPGRDHSQADAVPSTEKEPLSYLEAEPPLKEASKPSEAGDDNPGVRS